MLVLVNLFLYPGDFVLGLTKPEGEDHRGLVRMLVNSLVWTFAGILVALLFV